MVIDEEMVNVAADHVIQNLNRFSILSFHMISLLISYKAFKTESKFRRASLDKFESFEKKVENRAIEKLWKIKIQECN